MANVVNNNHIKIDTFGADVTIISGPGWLSSITMEGASAGDTATFINGDGEEILRVSNAADSASFSWSPAEPEFFEKGVVFDDSASSLAANDFVFVTIA